MSSSDHLGWVYVGTRYDCKLGMHKIAEQLHRIEKRPPQKVAWLL